MSTVVTGIGRYLPEKTVSNCDFANYLETSDSWIRSRTGIESRHISSESESCSAMATSAAFDALESAGRRPADVDLLIVATNTPDQLVPSVSSVIQHQLGANCPALTVVTGCTGFVYALITAHQFVATGASKCVVVVGADTISRFVDWNDRNTAVLFGDGAGAAVVEPHPDDSCGILTFDMGSDGASAMKLAIPGFGSAIPMTHDMIDRGDQYLTMSGSEVFKFAVRTLPLTTSRVLEQSGFAISDLDLLVPHQANQRIVDAATRSLGISPERVFGNIAQLGNTSAASIPLSLFDALEAGRIKPGNLICLASFGAGLTWASALIRWG